MKQSHIILLAAAVIAIIMLFAVSATPHPPDRLIKPQLHETKTNHIYCALLSDRVISFPNVTTYRFWTDGVSFTSNGTQYVFSTGTPCYIVIINNND